MAIIKNTDTTVVEATLTKRGREILSSGIKNFNIVKFAVSDDEVDYSLWNSSASTDEKGNYIEALPTLEASIDESKNMRYKLASFADINLLTVPYIYNINNTSVTLATNGTQKFTPLTQPNITEDYTCYVTNGDILNLSATTQNGTVKITTNKNNRMLTAVGTEFTINAKAIVADTTCQVIFVGNNTGATYTINVTVQQYDINKVNYTIPNNS